MYVTTHAEARISSRLGPLNAHVITRDLEQVVGEPGIIAYIMPGTGWMEADDGSNGDTVVVIAVDGSVETVYFRRSSQDMSPGFFGADKVVRL